MRLARILQEFYYSSNKNAQFAFFTSLPTDVSKCGDEAFKLLVLQVALQKENFNQ